MNQNVIKNRICLSMIVKNESHVIRRALESAAPHIVSWVISDTGSTDDTREIIRDFFAEKQIPGVLLENEWEDFATNRNHSLKLAREKGDYVLILDADEFLEHEDNFQFPILDAKGYLVMIERGGLKYRVNRLINSHPNWEWRGVLHEYMTIIGSPPEPLADLTSEVVIQSPVEGARSQNPKKYLLDAEVLEKGLEAEPDNLRYRFYLAQSYRDAGETEKALENYKIRAGQGGWFEEAYYAKLEVARCMSKLRQEPAAIINAYMLAQQACEGRLEAVYGAVRFCRTAKWYELGFRLGWGYREVTLADHYKLFISKDVYAWRFKDELAICTANSGRKKKSATLIRSILANSSIPPEHLDRLIGNLSYAEGRG